MNEKTKTKEYVLTADALRFLDAAPTTIIQGQEWIEKARATLAVKRSTVSVEVPTPQWVKVSELKCEFPLCEDGKIKGEGFNDRPPHHPKAQYEPCPKCKGTRSSLKRDMVYAYKIAPKYKESFWYGSQITSDQFLKHHPKAEVCTIPVGKPTLPEE